ncbi:hypothetical protein [Microtetraspora glauca]|uniref:hypothetical protein n=1 Tax=Microtetraspora glauca TaxID=1996 RepID=UPI0009E6C6BD
MAAKSPYPAELRKRTVRIVAEVRPDHPTEWAAINAINAVAAKLGIGTAADLSDRNHSNLARRVTDNQS